MGLFSSKKKIVVSSVVYNLAGDEKDRIQYLPTAVVGGVLSNSGASAADVISSSLLSGPGIRTRSFGRWARSSGYSTAIGLQTGQLILGDSLNIDVLVSQIPTPPGKAVSVQTAEIGEADYGFWADQWMLQNHPDQVNDDYEIDFSELTNTVFINFAAGGFYSFNPVGFNPNGQYLYVSYNLTDPPTEGSLVPGSTVSIGSPAEYPDTSGWSNNGTVSTPSTIALTETVETVVSYSDGRPDEESTTTTPSTASYTALDTEYEKKDYTGQAPGAGDQITATIKYQHNLRGGTKETTVGTDSTDEDIGGGVIKTTTVTTTTESLKLTYSYRIDTKDIVEKGWSTMQVMIYEKGTGNPTLDAMFEPDLNAGAYFPFIPIRLNNRFLSDTFYPDIYAFNKKAYRKAVGTTSTYDSLVASIEDNPSLGDIDFAFAVFGVSINTKEKASLKYVYKFFQALLQQGGGGVAEYNSWKVQWNIANNSSLAWNSWKEAQADAGNPLFGTPEPTQIPYPPAPLKNITVISESMNFRMGILWSSLTETTHTGQGKIGVNTGDLWWTEGVTEEFTEFLYGGKNSDRQGNRTIIKEFVTLNWQDSENTFRRINVGGLQHVNMVYGGKGVDTYAKDAINSADESGFIIPLHEGILKSMSLKDSTQMSTASTYMVFNCYEKVKQKWYQSSWFKIVIIVIAIVITVVTAGSGSPASAGLLGTAASVGAALGFAGVVAIIVGTVANAIAAMILTQIIMSASTAVFGDKVGAIVGAIGSVIAVYYGGQAMNGGTAAAPVANYPSLVSAQNLMNLTVAAGKGYAGYMQANIADIAKDVDNLMANYERESAEIAAKYQETLGFGGALIDPLALTDTFSPFVSESPESFLSRTLLVGSDIADLTNGLVSTFMDTTLSTELTF